MKRLLNGRAARILLPGLSFALVWQAVLRLTALAFGALFSAWGLTDSTYALAPVWAQWVVRLHTPCCYLLAGAAAGAVVHRMRGGAPTFGGGALRGALLGLACIGAALGAAFVQDSIRVDAGPVILPEQLPGLAAQLMTSGAVALLLATLDDAAGAGVLGWIVCATAGLLMTETLSVPAAAVSVLAALVALCLYRRHGLAAAAAFHAALCGIPTLVLAQPAEARLCTPVVTLYWVSDELLTGGSAGTRCGLWAAIALAAALAGLWLRKGTRIERNAGAPTVARESGIGKR